MSLNRFDLVIIGSGPAGQRAAVQAVKAGAKVAVVERRQLVGGVCLHAGTIPSKTLREAVLYLRGVRQRQFYGENFAEKQDVTMNDLQLRVNKVLEQELRVMDSQLRRNNVEMFYGTASFLDEHTIQVNDEAYSTFSQIQGDNFIIATGTIPRRPEGIEFDQEVIFDSDFIFSPQNKRKTLPRSLIVVGAGVIGSEYAAMFGVLGCKVQLVDKTKDLLRFADREIIKLLIRLMKENNVTFHLGTAPDKIFRTPEGRGRVEFDGGAAIEAEVVLVAMGRTPFTHPLGIDKLGVETDDRGRILVNRQYKTSRENIWAVGDVIGFPALASTSGEQGRMAAGYALNLDVTSSPELFPYGIYTIPEISMVGKSERELVSKSVPYGRGIAKYAEIAKAHMIGDLSGVVKILFHKDTLQVLGVHIIGDQASELIHIGQAVMSCGGTIHYFMDTVFNYPTLAEAYKVAAFNGYNVLKGISSVAEI